METADLRVSVGFRTDFVQCTYNTWPPPLSRAVGVCAPVKSPDSPANFPDEKNALKNT